MHDLVIRNGHVIDGTGAPGFAADIAIDGRKIAQVGKVEQVGREEIDARGQIVAPGFVDIHTHYDGQASWDPYLAPSSQHGVTTTVMGNCGVGFAPARPDQHDWLINLMEGVEDIPGTALAEGLTWDWETFPEYLDALDKRAFTMDVGTQIPHGALRTYVMDERAVSDETASPADIARMADLVEEGIRAGALGFSTSRVIWHRAKSGEQVPGTMAGEDELTAIFQAMAKASPNAVFEAAADIATDAEFELFQRLSRQNGLPVSLAMLQENDAPERWRTILQRIVSARAEGANMRAQITIRYVGLMFNWRTSLNPFMRKPAWRELNELAWEEKLVQLKNPETRRRMIEEPSDYGADGSVANLAGLLEAFDIIYATAGPIDYEPDPANSIGARARRLGVSPLELIYDALMADDGHGFVIEAMMNYAHGNYDHIFEMMDYEGSIFSLSDGGAHVGMICDASAPTFLLTHWARDRARGPKRTLEDVIRRQTSDTASFYGLMDRGVLAPGYLADINVIDHVRLELENPYIAFDLPAGGRRLLQRANGYTATIKSGIVVSREGKFTGALPGKLIRGPQVRPY